MLERMSEMMRFFKWLRMIGMVCFLICFGFENKTVSATSWVDLDPEEVEKRAEVVVLGTYDFSKNPKGHESVFEGYPFYVKSVYKGSTEEVIIVGIDGFDVGWAKEFQENDGTFLLFLERLDKAAFLTPVGGPNGMIQVVDDQVVPKEPFFDAILQRDAKDPEQGYDHFTPWQDYLWLVFITGMLIILLSFLVKKRAR